MLKRLTPYERFLILLEEFEPQMREAFMEAVEDIRGSVVLPIVIERLERGDINGAINALKIEPGAYRPLERVLYAAFEGGGISAVTGFPNLSDPNGGALKLWFSVRNPRAEAWLNEHSSNLITRIVEDQKQAVREKLEEGLAKGAGPRATALEVVGRVNRVTGRREGGIIGLTGPQAKAAAAARVELASGDRALMENYLTRKSRDMRFDRGVRAAIKNGKGLDKASVDKVVGRYSDIMLKKRADTIAQQETMAAVNAAQDEANRQLIDTGAVTAAQVTKVWKTAKDKRVRHSHAAIDGQVVPMNGKFGNGLLYPHQTGAPAAEVINCRCWCMYRIDRLAKYK